MIGTIKANTICQSYSIGKAQNQAKSRYKGDISGLRMAHYNSKVNFQTTFFRAVQEFKVPSC